MFKLRKYHRWIGVLLSVTLLVSAMAPMVFAETDDNTTLLCTLTESCMLEAGHTGDCVTEDADETAPICAQLPECTEGGHAPECPLHVPVESSTEPTESGEETETPACAQLPECTEDSHALECPLYVLAELTEEPTPSPSEEPTEKTEENAAAAANLAAPQADGVLYVSQDGSGNGSSQDAPANFLSAMEAAKDGDEFILVGTVALPEDWHTPDADITIRGNDAATSVLKMASGGTGSDDTPSISLEGSLTLDNLMLDVEKNPSPYYSSMFVIVANANSLNIGSGVSTPGDTSYYSGRIFGGGFHEGVTGDTNINIAGTLLVTNVFGGGCAGDVNGNTDVRVTGTCVTIYGGGLTVYRVSNTANVSGNTNITLENAQLTSRPTVYGGGDGSNADAIVGGDVTIYQNNVTDGGKKIYGAGESGDGDAYVGGNVSITSIGCDMSKNNATIYGAGTGDREGVKSAGVKGNVTITYENGNFGSIYGAGTDYANVDGTTTIHLSNNKGTPDVYGGGEGDDYITQSNGTVEINVLNTMVQLYTQGENARVNDLVTVNLLGGGADRDVNSVSTDFYNRVLLGSNNSEASEEFKSVINVLDGDNTVTTIHDFEVINVKNGILREHVTDYDGSGTSGDGPRHLFNNVEDVTIGNSGSLDILQDNEITGSFESTGNLTTVAGAALIVDQTVTSGSGASYTSSDAQKSYEESYAFLASKVDNAGSVAEFSSTDDRFFVDNRVPADEGFETEGAQREWYLDAHTYSVTFEENGGTEVQDLENVVKGSTITAPSTTKEGYTFIGWYKEAEFTTQWDFETDTVESDVTLYAKWNAPPVIVAEDKTLTVGDTFDPKEDVTASDEEDGDLTDAIEVLKNEVDTENPGVYEVTYKVTDKQGASSTKTIYVTVNPKMEILNAVPQIIAEDKTLTIGDTFDPKKDVTASDAEDGNLTDSVEVIKNEVDTANPGIYEVTYKVTDKQGASSTKTIYVTVNPKMEILNAVPQITAKDKTLTVGDTFDPKKDVTASDKEDGDLTSKIEVLKNEVNTSSAGIYEVTYKVTDSMGASVTKTIKVTVVAKTIKPSQPEENSGEPPTDTNTPDGGDQTGNVTSPQTGDNSNIALWGAAMLAAGTALIGAVLYNRKQKYSR